MRQSNNSIPSMSSGVRSLRVIDVQENREITLPRRRKTYPLLGPKWSLPTQLKPLSLLWLVAGTADMRKGFDGLSTLVQARLADNPLSRFLFVFRCPRGDRVKILRWDGDGLCLFYKRLERGKFIWPRAQEGKAALTPAQLSMLLEGIDWRRPERTAPFLAS